MKNSIHSSESSDGFCSHEMVRSELICVLGSLRNQSGVLPVNVLPDESKFFGPRAAIISDKRLWVVDTGHHRLLGWSALPTSDGCPADLILGQETFYSEGRNANGPVKNCTFNVPAGISSFGPGGNGLALADSWNNRVLLWFSSPKKHNLGPDLVLGQADFCSGIVNRGRDAGPDTLNCPSGVLYYKGILFVADSGNRRVLLWTSLPSVNGEPADIVLGQKNLFLRDENSGAAPGYSGMRWPHSIAVWNERLCVADAGNNRIMLWNSIPESSGSPCNIILGQIDSQSCSHNGGAIRPSSWVLNMPYGVSAAGRFLLVADTANSRVLAFDETNLQTGAEAVFVLGQENMNIGGDNRWMPASCDSLCWPYFISQCNDFLLVSDTGNNRVLLWNLVN